MCVAAIAWAAHPRWRLVAIANRDEFHARASAPLARWSEQPDIIAGRDLQAGGTWLGVSEAGRFALVTNFRREGYPRPGLASRGALVSDWLAHGGTHDGAGMNPFHLLCSDAETALHLTNWPHPSQTTLTPGLHGVSNGAFDTPWPKTARLARALGEWLAIEHDDPTALFAALADETRLPAEPDSEGPEQGTSPVFIRDPIYGTRCSTVVTVDTGGAGRIIERRFDARGMPTGETALDFRWPAVLANPRPGP